MAISKTLDKPVVDSVVRNIPFVDLKKQYQPLKESILQGFSNVLDGMHLFLGENVQAFENEFARICEVEHGIGVSDGTSAIHLILRAMDVGPGDEVITVSHTFMATVEAIVLSGATPVFVDIDPDTCLMDTTQVEQKITARTKALLPVHLYGQTVDMDPLMEIAEKYHLWVIEDACQAHGARYHEQAAGSLSDAAAFSFYFSKNLGGYGEGGFVSTRNDEIARKVRMLRDHGSETRYHHDLIGWNARLDELQAVVLRAKLPYLLEWNATRRRHAAQYRSGLAGCPLKLPVIKPDNLPNYHLFVIQTPQRDDLQIFLKERGIFTGIHYPIPVHMQKAMDYLGYKTGDFPATEKITREILSLPMYAELTEDDINYITDSVKLFFSL